MENSGNQPVWPVQLGSIIVTMQWTGASDRNRKSIGISNSCLAGYDSNGNSKLEMR